MDTIAFDIADPQAYALEVNGDTFAPIYRDGDILVISPAANTEPGSRVVVRTITGELIAREFVNHGSGAVQLSSIDGGDPESVPVSEIDFMARIVWASQ